MKKNLCVQGLVGEFERDSSHRARHESRFQTQSNSPKPSWRISFELLLKYQLTLLHFFSSKFLDLSNCIFMVNKIYVYYSGQPSQYCGADKGYRISVRTIVSSKRQNNFFLKKYVFPKYNKTMINRTLLFVWKFEYSWYILPSVHCIAASKSEGTPLHLDISWGYPGSISRFTSS